jgi:rhomboid family GlyGly-CTERM serine protease
MGFRQGDSSHPLNRSLAVWLLPGIIVGIAVVLAVYGDSGREWLRFDRTAVANGEYWRLVSGHFVHLGLSHLVLNAAGFLLIWYLVSPFFALRQWLLITLYVIAGIDLGFWLLEPSLQWYVGLSGLLHGLLAAGVVGGFRSGRPDVWILGAALVGKLAYEQLLGPLPGSEDSSGGAVIIAAHAYGALTGAIIACAILIRVRTQPSI